MDNRGSISTQPRLAGVLPFINSNNNNNNNSNNRRGNWARCSRGSRRPAGIVYSRSGIPGMNYFRSENDRRNVGGSNRGRGIRVLNYDNRRNRYLRNVGESNRGRGIGNRGNGNRGSSNRRSSNRRNANRGNDNGNDNKENDNKENKKENPYAHKFSANQSKDREERAKRYASWH